MRQLIINESEWNDKFKIRYSGRNDKGEILIEVKNLSKPWIPNFIAPVRRKFYLQERLHSLRMAKTKTFVEVSDAPKIKWEISETSLKFTNLQYLFMPWMNPMVFRKL